MNRQKLSTRYLLAIAVLIVLIGIGQPAAAKSKVYRLHAGETVPLGMQGLYVTSIPRGVSHVYLNTVGIHRPASFSPRLDLEFRPPAMEVRFLDEKGGKVERISALIYVYFNIGKAERELWVKSGTDQIAIWYTRGQTGSWEICPTFFIVGGGSQKTAGRLACLAQGSGYYALEGERITELPPAGTATPTLTPTLNPYPAWEPATTPVVPGPEARTW
jgi:hypothetical protein